MLSILMPAYNASATIVAAVTSVLKQTETELELIVVDDGSTDDTAAIVRRLGEHDARIRLLRQENCGLAAARNTAFSCSSGEYVCLLDADDLLLSEYVATMKRTLDAVPSAAFAYTDAWVLDDESRRIRRDTVMARWLPTEGPAARPELLLRQLLVQNFVFVSTTIRRSILESVGGFDERLRRAEDYELWLRILGRGGSAVRVAEPLALYRARRGSLSSDRGAMLQALADVYRIVAEEHETDDEARALALRRRRECEAALAEHHRQRERRRLERPRKLLRPVKRALLRRRMYYARPPEAITTSFPDLKAL
jgi:glycosyltransferase involved in cell wall biosynthesis